MNSYSEIWLYKGHPLSNTGGGLLRSVISISSLCRRRDVPALLANMPASQWDAWEAVW